MKAGNGYKENGWSEEKLIIIKLTRSPYKKCYKKFMIAMSLLESDIQELQKV
jgi:hypothetical protein